MAETAPAFEPVSGDVPEVADHGPAATGTVAEAEHAAAHETFLGLDSYAWVGAAFLCFVLLLWKLGAFRMIGTSLDAQAVKVKADLAEAAQLKAEAEAMKAKAAADAADAEASAKAMLANAEVEAKRIVEQATVSAEEAIARRTRLAEDRIAAEARGAEAELRARAAEITVKAAEAILAGKTKELAGLTDAAIAGLDRR
ncbi:MAG: F0F1 ATP synthase subunit B [Sandaracinobacter sp.]